MTVGLPSVSVLIAAYNARKYIGETLKSIFSQTSPPSEVIIVDDGSNDGLVEELEIYSDSRLHVIRQENSGAAAARNRAFSASRGRFVIFVDADDVIGPCHLECLASRLAHRPRCVALSSWDRFYSDLDVTTFPHRPTEFDMGGKEWLLTDWRNCRPMTQSGMFLIPRVLIEQNGAWDERLSLNDDFEFFARIISSCDAVLFSPGARLYYRSGHSGTLSRRRDRAAVESALLSLMLGTQYLLNIDNTARAKRVCADLFKNFEYAFYPHFPDLLLRARTRVAELGGADLIADGPPGFNRLRPLIGWKLARRVQRLAERLRYGRMS